jgi:hypothetical protein
MPSLVIYPNLGYTALRPQTQPITIYPKGCCLFLITKTGTFNKSIVYNTAFNQTDSLAKCIISGADFLRIANLLEHTMGQESLLSRCFRQPWTTLIGCLLQTYNLKNFASTSSIRKEAQTLQTIFRLMYYDPVYVLHSKLSEIINIKLAFLSWISSFTIVPLPSTLSDLD